MDKFLSKLKSRFYRRRGGKRVQQARLQAALGIDKDKKGKGKSKGKGKMKGTNKGNGKRTCTGKVPLLKRIKPAAQARLNRLYDKKYAKVKISPIVHL